jgi:lipoyl(octanoyl) transferase
MAQQIFTRSLVEAGPIEYNEGLALQRQIHEAVASGLDPSTLILLEHQNVFTAGKRTEVHERPLGNVEVIDVDRGGKITWHGIGQLVAYPIIKLANPQEVVGYVRDLEDAIINTLSRFDITGVRIRDRSGVWIKDSKGERKIAAIGIRVARGVTMHGIAINANCDLSHYSKIIPCGIIDAGVTSISKEHGSIVTISDLAPLLERELKTSLHNIIDQNFRAIEMNLQELVSAKREMDR